MKFFLFSDFHFQPGVFLGGSLSALRDFKARAVKENCQFAIHAGDYSNSLSYQLYMIEEYNNFPIPAYHAFGNHDCDCATYEEVLGYFGLEKGYYYFDVDGYRMIVLDPNYYYHDGEYVHYAKGNYVAHEEERDWVPPEQLAFLREAIATAPGSCLIFSHESFERPDGVKNRDEVRAIIREANERRPHSVLACFNGHYHRDHHEIIEGVLYMEVNAVTFDWLAEGCHDKFPPMLCANLVELSQTVVYNDPLCCVVTVEGTTIRVEGTESSMFMGVTRESIGFPTHDAAGRPVVPRISSYEVTL